MELLLGAQCTAYRNPENPALPGASRCAGPSVLGMGLPTAKGQISPDLATAEIRPNLATAKFRGIRVGDWKV